MSLGERLSDLRNRLFADERFQSFAAAFWPTRPIANARARALFDLCAGFVYSQILFACVEFDLFRRLQNESASVETLAAEMGLTPEAADRLLRAGAALKLFERRGARYALGADGAALLGNPSVFAMVRHHAALYADMADPAALLREGRGKGAVARFWGYAAGDAPEALSSAQTQPYTELMAQTQAFVAAEVLSAYDFKTARRLLDVGGGAGAFLAAVGAAAAHLDLMLFDLPAVAETARGRLNAAGLGARTQIVAGDFLRDPLPPGADVISFVRVLHDHDDAPVRRLLASAHDALAPGGHVLIAEPMAETPGAAAMGDAYFGLYLWAMGSGRPRSAQTLRGFLEDAGFSSIRILSTRRPVLTRAITAERA